MLAAVVLSDEGLHLRAIADRTGLPYSVVQREVDRLEQGGLVKSTKFHTARVVRPVTHNALFPELRALLLKAYGPVEILRELLADEPAVDAAYLFGSWAARYEGEWGEPPADLDVLIIGRVLPRRVEELEAEAEDRLGRPVQITVVSRGDWHAGKSGFVRTVKRRPRVSIFGEAE